jgi:hypothetical protein
MSKIVRKTAQIFAQNAISTDIEQFASMVVTGSPNYSNDPDVIQSLSAWGEGWTAALTVNNTEFKQDRNAVDYVASYQIAYILQQGIPEWDSGTTYYTNSIIQYGGQLFQSLVDSNLNNTPPSTGNNSYWRIVSIIGALTSPTRTVLTSGSGTYTPPTGCVRIYFRMVGGGGGGAGSNTSIGLAGQNGGNTTLGSYTANGGGGGSTSGPGAGGTSTFGSFNVNGGPGSFFLNSNTGANGANSIFGGAGQSTYGDYLDGFNAVANSGAGGGGAASTDSVSGGGGGAGGYGELQIVNPTSMSYSVGAAGAGGSGYYNGGNGGSGVIIIDEFYY